jgi:hypothetical protein
LPMPFCPSAPRSPRPDPERKAMPRRRREYNTIRTDMLEGRIAFYEAYERHTEAVAIRRLAKEINAPIDEQKIQETKAIHLAHRKQEWFVF